MQIIWDDTNKMNIKNVNKSKDKQTEYSTERSAGANVGTNTSPKIRLSTLERVLVRTGHYNKLPEINEAQMRAKREQAIKNRTSNISSPGKINADYREEIYNILLNLSNDGIFLSGGDRICQMIILKHKCASWIEINEHNGSDRDTREFVHTGKE
jgi:deoxyuridine 5'-triphosphate nucleotidohydrolase